jgi:hypothetical protein
MGFFNNILKSIGVMFLGQKSEGMKEQERLQERLLAETEDRRKKAEQEKMLEEDKLNRVKKRASRSRRRSVLFTDQNENPQLKDTLG